MSSGMTVSSCKDNTLCEIRVQEGCVRKCEAEGRILESRGRCNPIARTPRIFPRDPVRPVLSADGRDDAAPPPHPFLAGLAFEVAEQRPSTLHKRQEPSTPPSSTP